MSFLPLGLLVTLLLSSTPVPLTADPAGTRLLTLTPPLAVEDLEEGQRWSVSPYFWMSEIEGAVTVRGNRVSGLVPFSDILDHLDFAFLVHVERRDPEGEWSILIDSVTMWLEQDFDGPTDAEVNLTVATVEAASAYRLFDLEDKLGVPVTIEGIAGVRYVFFEAEIDTAVTSGRSQDDDFLDPLVGLRGVWGITEGFWLAARGDIGGFGIGSELSWQLVGTIAWDPNEHWSVLAGYRLLDIDYSDGDGNREQGLDLQFRGPTVGVMVRF